MKRTPLLLILALVAGTALGAGPTAPAPAAEPLVLTPENTAIYDASVYAGRYLQYYLLKCVAKSPDAARYALDAQPEPDRTASPAFPLYKDPAQIPAGKNVIAIGNVPMLPEAWLPKEDAARLNEKSGSILVRRTGNRVLLAVSGQDNWDFSHLRTFLDKAAGIRMYAPSEEDLWLSVPRGKRIEVGALDVFQRPYVVKDGLAYSLPRNKEWHRMNPALHSGSELRASHTINRFFDPEKYHSKHPELFPMAANGTRPKPSGASWNPCLANTELLATVALGEIREQMKAKPPPSYLSLAVMDHPFDCQCPTCQESFKKHNDSASNLYYAFLNRLARDVRKEFPDLLLTAYVYANVRTPPVGMTIEPNIVVDLVTKSYNWADPARLEAEKERIRAFSRLGAGWIIHDWDFSGVTPRIYNRQWAAFLQWAGQNGMRGTTIEWSHGESWYLEGAKYWVLKQLLSDPYQDVDGLWRQYCRDMYGAGAEEMYRFYDMFAEKHVFSDDYCFRDDLPRREMACFFPADLALQRKWLEAAVAKTKDDPLIQKRLAFVMRYFTAHELYTKAVGEPARLYHRYTTLEKKTGINKEALAFYANDDGKALLEAAEYYDTKRTVVPDSNQLDVGLGAALSYRSNYSRALGTILQAVRAEALQGKDVASFDAKAVKETVARSTQIYRANLPAKHDAKRAKEIEALFQKILWVPRLKEMPKIDGDPSDPQWKDAAELRDFTLADLLIPSQMGNETEGRIARFGDQLLVTLTCKQPGGVWAETAPTVEMGTSIFRESCAEIFLIPLKEEQDGKLFSQYVVNALGAFRGYNAARDNRAGVQCAAKVAPDKKSYTLEFAIPLKCPTYDYTGVKAFTFTVMRQVYHSNSYSPPERLGWAPLFLTASVPESRGLIILE